MKHGQRRRAARSHERRPLANAGATPGPGIPGLSNDPSLETRAHVAGFLAQISWAHGCPLPTLLYTEDMEPTGVEVTYPEVRLIADIRVRDRETNEALTVTGGEVLILPTSTLVVFTRTIALLQRLWMHELAESLLLNGIRILDPHKGT